MLNNVTDVSTISNFVIFLHTFHEVSDIKIIEDNRLF